MPFDLKDQYFGTEIEMTGITREQAAKTVAELLAQKSITPILTIHGVSKTMMEKNGSFPMIPV